MVSATAVKIAAIFMVSLTIGQLMAEASSSSSPQPRRLLEVDDDDGEVVEAELDEATLLADELATIVQGCRSICHRHPSRGGADAAVNAPAATVSLTLVYARMLRSITDGLF